MKKFFHRDAFCLLPSDLKVGSNQQSTVNSQQSTINFHHLVVKNFSSRLPCYNLNYVQP
ncbi:MAG: hypothetical protein F6K41_17660 [Symploca sp. SIO3E6]|nr:hypothetical protein [Caldora sp. SIO3E6]